MLKRQSLILSQTPVGFLAGTGPTGHFIELLSIPNLIREQSLLLKYTACALSATISQLAF